ncbi:adenylyl-sulfate kinase, partial [bacterium]|nr:adenylyl-sulfate kinase [bacterium]
MFDELSEKLEATFAKLRGRGSLSEADVKEGLREVRRVLLEADVNFQLTGEFLKRVEEKAVGVTQLKSVSPAQQLVKIVYDELTVMLGERKEGLRHSTLPPTVILMVGLQGSGKTTTAAKLARKLKGESRQVSMIAGDVYRPAAIDQLETLGRDLEIKVYADRTTTDVVKMEAVKIAQGFNDALNVTGVILTKLDGDARGGAALSIYGVLKKPIKYIGVGEKTDALEEFHPDRMAGRILQQGDILSLVEKAQESFDADAAKKLEKKVRKEGMDLNDFLAAMKQIQKLGPLEGILKMLPGVNSKM